MVNFWIMNFRQSRTNACDYELQGVGFDGELGLGCEKHYFGDVFFINETMSEKRELELLACHTNSVGFFLSAKKSSLSGINSPVLVTSLPQTRFVFAGPFKFEANKFGSSLLSSEFHSGIEKIVYPIRISDFFGYVSFKNNTPDEIQIFSDTEDLINIEQIPLMVAGDVVGRCSIQISV